MGDLFFISMKGEGMFEILSVSILFFAGMHSLCEYKKKSNGAKKNESANCRTYYQAGKKGCLFMTSPRICYQAT